VEPLLRLVLHQFVQGGEEALPTFVADRFFQEQLRAAAQAGRPVHLRRMSGQDHFQHVWIFAMKQPEELHAVHDRHADVDHHQVDPLLPNMSQRPRRVRRRQYLPGAFGSDLHQVLDHFQKTCVVVDEQDRCVPGWHASPLSAGRLPARPDIWSDFGGPIGESYVGDLWRTKKQNTASIPRDGRARLPLPLRPSPFNSRSPAAPPVVAPVRWDRRPDNPSGSRPARPPSAPRGRRPPGRGPNAWSGARRRCGPGPRRTPPASRDRRHPASEPGRPRPPGGAGEWRCPWRPHTAWWHAICPVWPARPPRTGAPSTRYPAWPL